LIEVYFENTFLSTGDEVVLLQNKDSLLLSAHYQGENRSQY